jgi:hypothetical protein
MFENRRMKSVETVLKKQRAKRKRENNRQGKSN